MSPNDLFTTAEELGIKVAMDDRQWLRRAAVHPYALVAFEIDAQPGVGQKVFNGDDPFQATASIGVAIRP